MTEQPPGWSSPDPQRSAASASGPPTAFQPAGLPAAAPPRRPVRGVVPLRPFGVGELLDGSVAVVRRYPRPVLAASAAVAVVGAVLQLLVTLSVRTSLTHASSAVAAGSSDALTGLLGTAAVATGLNVLVDIVTGAVLTGIMTAVVGRAVFGQTTDVRDAWQALRPRLVPLLLVSFVVAVATYGAFFGALGLVALAATVFGGGGAGVAAFVLVPLGSVAAVLLYIRWSLAPAVVVLEKQRVGAALRRSSVLVARSFWRVLGVLVLAALIALFVGLVLQLPFQVLGFSPLRGFGSGTVELSTGTVVVGAVASALVATVVAPFAAGVRALLYVDRRMRAEGLDVALNAAAAARQP